MATTTTYLTLRKEIGSETYNVDTTLNDNWDKIDALLNPTTQSAAGSQVVILKETAVTPSYTGSTAANTINLQPTWNSTGTVRGIYIQVTHTAAGASSRAIEVRRGASDIIFDVDITTAAAANGISIIGRAAGTAPTVQVVSSGTNEGLDVRSKGTGTVSISTNALNRIRVDNGYQLTLFQTTANVTLVWSDPAAARTLTIPDPGAAATFVLTRGTATFSAEVKTFNSSILAIRNPADTFSYTVVASAITAARNLTIPLITADDTLAVLGLAQTWTALQSFGTNLGGTLQTAAQANVTSVGTLTSITTSGSITMTAGASQIIPGATSWAVRNNANTANNIIITDAGAVTLRGTLDMSNNAISNIGAAGTDFSATGGLTLADALTVSAGGASITQASSYSSITGPNTASRGQFSIVGNAAGVAPRLSWYTSTTFDFALTTSSTTITFDAQNNQAWSFGGTGAATFGGFVDVTAGGLRVKGGSTDPGADTANTDTRIVLAAGNNGGTDSQRAYLDFFRSDARQGQFGFFLAADLGTIAGVVGAVADLAFNTGGVYRAFFDNSDSGRLVLGGGITAAGTAILTDNVLRGSSTQSTFRFFNTGSVANNGVAAASSIATPNGWLFVVTDTGDETAIFIVNGGLNSVREVSDPAGIFSSTAGTASSTNIYYSAGNARYEIENKRGGARTYSTWSMSM